MVAAATGVIVGASVAIAGAVALKDKKNRENVKQILTNIKDQTMGYVEDLQKQTQNKKGEIEEKLAEGKEKVEKVESSVNDVKRTTRTK